MILRRASVLPLPGTLAAARTRYGLTVSVEARSPHRGAHYHLSLRSRRGSSPTHPPADRCSSAAPQLPASAREALLRLSYRLSFVQCLYQELVSAVELRLYSSDRDA